MKTNKNQINESQNVLVSKVIFMVYVQQYTRLQASQSDKDSEMETLRSTQQELDALQAKV